MACGGPGRGVDVKCLPLPGIAHSRGLKTKWSSEHALIPDITSLKKNRKTDCCNLRMNRVYCKHMMLMFWFLKIHKAHCICRIIWKSYLILFHFCVLGSGCVINNGYHWVYELEAFKGLIIGPFLTAASASELQRKQCIAGYWLEHELG